MYNIRAVSDKRGDTLTPNAEVLALQRILKFGIDLVLEGNLSASTDWTGVVTNPGLFYKSKLS